MTTFLQRHPLLRRALLLLVVFYCFHAALLELKASRQYRQVATWPVTQVAIGSSAVYWTGYSWSRRQNRYCPKLEYTYIVQGRIYEGHNQVFDFVCWPDAYDFVAKHRPGTFIKIAYDPTDPATTIVPDAVRDPGYPWIDVIGGMIFAAILLGDLLGTRTSDRTPDALESAPQS